MERKRKMKERAIDALRLGQYILSCVGSIGQTA